MSEIFKPFSMMDIWNAWSKSGEAFENATADYVKAKDKVATIGQTLVQSEEGKRIKELTDQISALNLELASAMTTYTTRAMTGTLTKVGE